MNTIQNNQALSNDSNSPKCRFCQTPLNNIFANLGMSPLCQTHIEERQLDLMEPFFPLRAYVCGKCFLVQLGEYVAPEDIFTEYAYFSSYADSWVEHAKCYTDMVQERLKLNPESLVVEIASNDGYLLQHFINKNIPVLGVEPAANVAKVALEKGIRTEVQFFGEKTANQLVKKYGKANLLLGNNVLAHVPDLNDFVSGMKVLLKSDGVITMEFPHLLQLMDNNQFDTIYHEHFSYFSFITVEQVFASHGLTLFDVEEIKTHGGSLRIFARHVEDIEKKKTDRVSELHNREQTLGFNSLQIYAEFEDRVKETKRSLLDFLINAKRAGKTIVGYGAPGKGNTLLNYCAIRQDFIDYTVDRNPYKQGKYTPGTRIPICAPDKICETKPDYIFILPWNLKEEIMEQLSYVRCWGGKFIVPIPEVKVY